MENIHNHTPDRVFGMIISAILIPVQLLLNKIQFRN